MLSSDVWGLIIGLCSVSSLVSLGRTDKALHQKTQRAIQLRMEDLFSIRIDPRISVDDRSYIDRAIKRAVRCHSSVATLTALTRAKYISDAFNIHGIYMALTSSLVATRIRKHNTLGWIKGANGVTVTGLPFRTSVVAGDFSHQPGSDNVVLQRATRHSNVMRTLCVVLPDNTVLMRPAIGRAGAGTVHTMLQRFALNFHPMCCICGRHVNRRVCSDCTGTHSTVMLTVVAHTRSLRRGGG
jgi:hypothetical protein